MDNIPYTQEERQRLNKAGGEYIRNKMRESCIPDLIMPPRGVGTDEMHRGISTAVPGVETPNDGMAVHVLCDKNAETEAMEFGDKIVTGHRYAVPLTDLSTDPYERTEPELVAYGSTLLDLIDETIFRQAVLDKNKKFLDYCQLAVSASGQSWVNSGDLQERLFLDIKHPGEQADHPVLPSIALMSQRVCTKKVREFLENHGVKIIRSLNTELFDTWEDNRIQESDIWLFSPPDMLGDNLFHDTYKIWSTWEGPLFTFKGWEMAGIGIKDIHAITKIKVMY